MSLRTLLDRRSSWIVPAAAARVQLLSVGHKVAFVAVLFLFLLCSMPPDGLLTDNEEDYFQIAQRFVAGNATPDSALFDSSPHRGLNDVVLGGLVVAIGYERAQIVSQLVVIAAFSILLYALLDLFGLSSIDGAIVLAVFGIRHEQIMGGEWLFYGYEAKVAAYAFVIAGFVTIIARRRSWTSVPLFAVATYFHFLVGIFWFHAGLLWRVIEDRGGLKSAIIKAGWFWLAVAPLIALIEWKRWMIDAAIPLPPGLPSPDYIYSILREPWHAAPFVSRHSFVNDWLPGCLLSAGMLAGSVVIAGAATDARLRTTARWLAILLVYLFAAMVLCYFYRWTGVLGKFYPFRPSSLILLIWLVMVLGWLNELLPHRHAHRLKLVAGALVIPPFLAIAVLNLHHDIMARAEIASDKRIIIDFLRDKTPSDSVILVDPEIEQAFLDIERTTHRFGLIMWEFMPTNDPQILEWHRRMEYRRSIFQQGCRADPIYHTDYLLTTRNRKGLLEKSCGPPILETDRFSILPAAGSDASDAVQH
jgi:hypothetical protein